MRAGAETLGDCVGKAGGFCLLTWLAFCFFLYFWRAKCHLDKCADGRDLLGRVGLDCFFSSFLLDIS